MTDLCVKCSIRPGTLDWVGEGGALAHVHGFSVRWCEVCATTAQLEYARKLAAAIPELEAKLATLSAQENR